MSCDQKIHKIDNHGQPCVDTCINLKSSIVGAFIFLSFVSYWDVLKLIYHNVYDETNEPYINKIMLAISLTAVAIVSVYIIIKWPVSNKQKSDG